MPPAALPPRASPYRLSGITEQTSIHLKFMLSLKEQSHASVINDVQQPQAGVEQKASVFYPEDAVVFIRRASDAHDQKSPESL